MPARACARASGRLPEHELQSLYIRAEQQPNRDSRVTLATRRDALGMPQAHLEWRLTDLDTDSIRGWLSTLDGELQTARTRPSRHPTYGLAETDRRRSSPHGHDTHGR